MSSDTVDMEQLTALAPLYRKMRMGTHIGRLNEPVLWANLEANYDEYARLFRALGYQLGMDPRGFAWLDEERDAAVDETRLTKGVRTLAVMIATLFDYQASVGRSLHAFIDWRIDDQLLAHVLESQREALANVEISSVDAMRDQLRTATNWGFSIQEKTHWKLLPSVSRFTDSYLDQVERLDAVNGRDADDEDDRA